MTGLRGRVETEQCGAWHCHRQVPIVGRHVVRSRHSGRVLCDEHAVDCGQTASQREREQTEAREAFVASLSERARERDLDDFLRERANRAAVRASATVDDWRLMIAAGIWTTGEARAHGVVLDTMTAAPRRSGAIDTGPPVKVLRRAVFDGDARDAAEVGAVLCPSGLWEVRTAHGSAFLADEEEAAARADEVRAGVA